MTDISLPDPTDKNDSRWLTWLAAAIAIVHIGFNTVSTLPENWTAAVHFGLFGFFLTMRAAAHTTSPAMKIVNGLLATIAIASPIYLILFEDDLYARGVTLNTADWIAAGATMLLAFELVRRTTGWLIPILALIALSYVILWGKFIPGVFHFPGLHLETMLFRNYFGTDGLFGPIARISWSYVFMFILFGAFLMRSGGSEAIMAIAQSVAGRLHGGPGFVAVLSSGLMGSISGSAIANTASTGIFTIPLMKRTGFPPRFAAGIEAAASTGGQLMPPVMGAGAFIMANFTGTSYLTIIGYAALPAILYFFSVCAFVRIKARQLNLKPAETLETQTSARPIWTTLLPIPVLVILLIFGLTPTYAAALSILSVIAISWASPNPMGPKAITAALADGTRNMAATAVLLITVGIIVNAVTTTGLGNTLSLMIGTWAGSNLLLALVCVAIASLILGLGLPVTAAYIVLATLSAPLLFNLMSNAMLMDALTQQPLPENVIALLAVSMETTPALLRDGLSAAQARDLTQTLDPALLSLLRDALISPAHLTAILITAHLIIFWLSQDSNVTPPVSLAAFTAASIAGTPPFSTGLTAWKLAKGLYIVPLLMAFSPLMTGSTTEAALVFAAGLVGIYAAAGMLQGHLEGPLTPITWAATALAALCLLWPHNLPVLWGVGVVLLTIAVWHSRRSASPS